MKGLKGIAEGDFALCVCVFSEQVRMLASCVHLTFTANLKEEWLEMFIESAVYLSRALRETAGISTALSSLLDAERTLLSAGYDGDKLDIAPYPELICEISEAYRDLNDV